MTDYNKKLAFKCRKLKRASPIRSTFTRDGVVHIMKNGRAKFEKIAQVSKLVELFPDFDCHDDE